MNHAPHAESLRSSLKVSAVLLGLTLMASPLRAQIWNGGGTPDGNWGNSLNWDVLPVDGNALTFDGAVNTTTTNNNLTTVSGITYNVGASAFSHYGNDLILGGNIINNSASQHDYYLNTT